MAKVRFRGDKTARVTHTVDGKQCVHEFPCELEPDSACFRAVSVQADLPDVPITSQPEKEPA